MRLPLLALLLALAPAAARAQPLIVLDAGHGGTDPGAVGCSLEEAAVVLDVTQRLQVLLEAAGVRVALTRSDDTFVGLSERAAFANARGADGFVSVHSNSNAGTPATGTETFIHPGAGARTRELGQLVQDGMIAAWMLRDRGLKEADFAVLRETSMPAALGELAFTNNCGVDAVLLADPDARQRMALAYRDAILAWLGIDPTMIEGTLRGIVFEDQGVGTEDVTVRLPGASVRVVETGATAVASDVEGAFSFALPPGSYTLEASAAGHVAAMRTCNVSAGVATDCAIGLLPIAAEADAASAGDAGPAGPGREPVAGCGCSAGTRGASSIAAIALVLAIVLARRRRALLATLALAGCAHDPGPASVAPITVVLGEAREILAAGRADPVLSPEGSRVAIASEDHQALFVAELDDPGSLREVCRTGRCGWAPAWQGEGELAYRVSGQSGTAVPAEARAIDAMERVPVRVGTRGVHAWIDEDDRAWLRIEGRSRPIGPEGERMIDAVLAPDRAHVVLWGMHEGVLVHRVADGRTVRVGPGGHPRVDPSGRWLVFERTEDDGHAITRGDLHVCDLRDYAVAPLVVSDDRIERTPSLSRIVDGRGVLAFMAEGVLVVRAIELRR